MGPRVSHLMFEYDILLFFEASVEQVDCIRKGLRALGVRCSDNMGVYLGHQLVHHGNNRRVFDGLIQRVQQRRQGWKSKCLSRAGRITLAQSVINSMGVY